MSLWLNNQVFFDNFHVQQMLPHLFCYVSPKYAHSPLRNIFCLRAGEIFKQDELFTPGIYTFINFSAILYAASQIGWA